MANTLIFTLLGHDKLSPAFKSAGKSADGLQGKLGVIGKAGNLGKTGLLAVGSAAVGAGLGFGKSISKAADFDKSIRKVGAIASVSGQGLDELSKLALKMGQDTVFSAADAGAAMVELAKGGMTAAQIKGGALEGTMTLAAAGELQMADAATYLSNTLNVFGLQAKDSNRVVAALAGGANASSASVESLGQALSQVGPGAKTAGVSLETTVGILAAFDNAGIKGSDAGTSFKTMLARLVPTSNAARDSMRELGLKFTDANGKFLPMRDVAEQLRVKLSHLSDEQRTQAFQTIFGSDATRAATTLMNLGAAGVDKYTKATSDQAAAQKLAKVGVEGAAGAIENFKGSVETLAIQLGTKLLPAFTNLTNFTTRRILPIAGDIIESFSGFAGRLAPKVSAGFTEAGTLIDKAVDAWGPSITGAITDIDFKGVALDLGTKAKGWGQGVVAGFKTGVDTGDWSSLGQSVGDGMVTAIRGAAKVGGEIAGAIGDLFGKVDWFEVGKTVGLEAPSFAIGFLDSLVDGIIKVAKAHPFVFALTLASIIFAPAKFLKPVIKVLEKIPFVGAIAKWILESLNKLDGPILKGIGFIGRAFMSGFRRVFPGIGDNFGKWLALLPYRVAVLALDMQAAALRMLRGLVNGIGRGVVWVVAKIGELTGYVVKPFAKAGGWLLRKGFDIVMGLLRGIGNTARGIGTWTWNTLGRPVVNTFSRAGSWLVNHGRSVVNGLKSGLWNVARGIGSWTWANVGRPIVSTFTGAGRWLYGHGSSLINGLKSGLWNVARGIGSWVWSNVGRPIVNTFIGTGRWLYGHGANLVRGLGHGVDSAMRGIGGWVKGHIVDPIVKNVKDFFGIKSPSTVFAGIGGNMVKGLIRGLGSVNMPKVVGKIFGGMPKALGAIVNKGLVSIGSLPGKAMDALRAIGFGGNTAVIPPGLLKGLVDGAQGYVGGSGVERWRAVALQALRLTGSPASWIGSLLRRMNQESGGNPRAINLWDSNAKRGTPSMGLMQTILPTFNAYAGAWRKFGPWNPLANIIASIKYANAAYGSAPRGWNRPGGYKDGGWLLPGRLAYNETSKPEAVFNQAQLRDLALAGRGGAAEYHFHLDGAIIGSQQQALDWLTKGIDKLKQQRRI